MVVTGNSATSREVLAPQAYPAVCCQVVDLGMQSGKFGTKRKVRIAWEILGETVEINGKHEPLILGKNYTASISEKSTLGGELASWRGKPFTPEELKGFNLQNILGVKCTLSIGNKPKNDGSGMIEDITSVGGWMKGMAETPRLSHNMYFNMDSPDWELWKELPDFIKKWIEEGATYKASDNPYHGFRNKDSANHPTEDEPQNAGSQAPAQAAAAATTQAPIKQVDSEDDLPF